MIREIAQKIVRGGNESKKGMEDIIQIVILDNSKYKVFFRREEIKNR
jgi:hypothetical protein